jgi:hypothetical protein
MRHLQTRRPRPGAFRGRGMALNAAAFRRIHGAQVARSFRVGTGAVHFDQILDRYGRVVFAFELNSVDSRRNAVFAAQTYTIGSDESSRLFIPEVGPPAAGKFRPVFVAPPNSHDAFMAYPNMKVGGKPLFGAVANSLMDERYVLLPHRQVPLNDDKWPLFVGHRTLQDAGGNSFFSVACNEVDEDGISGFVATPSYQGKPGLEIFYFCPSNFVAANGERLFVAKCNQVFDGLPAFVAPYNFIRGAGSHARPASRTIDLNDLKRRMRDSAASRQRGSAQAASR